ncbi:MAG: hypothetical protein HYZ57_09050 [Acidobacteria bacterium]|nr:hypothetical protein [Acidobacteriota bacterium]
MRRVILLSAVLILTPALHGEATLEGPVSGVVYEKATKSLRPVTGVPGAAYLGGAIAGELDFAVAAPSGRIALAVREGRLYLVRPGAEPAIVPAEPEVSAVERIAWSRDSSAAAVVAGGRVLAWKESGIEDLGEAAGNVTALAATQEFVLAAVANEGIYLYDQGSVRLVARAAEVAGLAAAQSDLLFADSARGELVLVRDFAGAAAPSLVAAIADPAGVAFSSDAQVAMVAAREARTVRGFSLASGEETFALALEFTPLGLQPLTSGLFVLATAEPPLQVMRIGPEPAVYFVPAGGAEE